MLLVTIITSQPDYTLQLHYLIRHSGHLTKNSGNTFLRKQVY